MPKGVYAAASAMITEQRMTDLLSENMANINTHGYRRGVAVRESFAELLARDGRRGDVGGNGGVGIRHREVWRSHAQAELENTHAPLDVALEGEGYFRVRDDQDRLLLTRQGRFTTDLQGRMVTQEGFQVEGQAGPLILPEGAESLTIDESGRVSVRLAGVETFVDQLRVDAVPEDQLNRLHAVSGQYFDPGDLVTTDSTTHRVRQGWLERANVDPVAEMVAMIAAQRRYDAAQSALSRQLSLQGYSDILRGT